MPDERGLPPVVARMWGREQPSRRGPRPSLTLEQITAAAIAIADEEGLSGVSMGAVAARLGVATMSLYRYVGSKSELLTAMLDAVPAGPPPLGDAGWREYLAVWTRANRDMLLAHPWMLHVARTAPPVGPRSMHWLDRALAAMADTLLDDGEKISIATTLTGYANSDALLTHSLTAAAAARGPDGLGTVDDYGALLTELLDAEHYPTLSRVVASGVFAGGEEWVQDADFRFGLDLLLDGVEALVARRAART
ncbi:TetR/AcrR family transcriptional regulator [Georgenia subflava]|uniref:TetR family transcriptional regulator n=1 Tax=Georgenia subflava TaxID=1622177 RepID=A0A6N7EK89_9MICO|nr:TetR/AcrR family transcriptional regulator [Georgenia subflava]MPV36975.1 TetR family transcriptional regulator [Georgenia subflava]